MKSVKTKSRRRPVRQGRIPNDRIKAVKETANEQPKIFKLVRFAEAPDIDRRDFLRTATKAAGVTGVAALSGLLTSCFDVGVNKCECTCELQTGNMADACTCNTHTARCTCDTVAGCTCDTVCSCDLHNGQQTKVGKRFDKGICTCDTVCTCNQVAVCTCQVTCTCQSTCSCQVTGHYWYPN